MNGSVSAADGDQTGLARGSVAGSGSARAGGGGADGLTRMDDRRFLRARAILIAVGVLGLILGAVVLVQDQTPVQILGVALWLVGAIILHDAILSPLVLVVSVVARRAGRRLSPVVLAVIQGAVVVGAILTLLVVPEVYAKTLGTANATVLPFDYGARLAVMWAVLAVVTAAVSLVYLRARRRR